MKNGMFIDFYDILKLDQPVQRMWFITIGYSSIILPGSIRYTQKEVMGVYKNILMEGVVYLFIICRIHCIELFLTITGAYEQKFLCLVFTQVVCSFPSLSPFLSVAFLRALFHTRGNHLYWWHLYHLELDAQAGDPR